MVDIDIVQDPPVSETSVVLNRCRLSSFETPRAARTATGRSLLVTTPHSCAVRQKRLRPGREGTRCRHNRIVVTLAVVGPAPGWRRVRHRGNWRPSSGGSDSVCANACPRRRGRRHPARVRRHATDVGPHQARWTRLGSARLGVCRTVTCGSATPIAPLRTFATNQAVALEPGDSRWVARAGQSRTRRASADILRWLSGALNSA
jgi:hypothetical protein